VRLRGVAARCNVCREIAKRFHPHLLHFIECQREGAFPSLRHMIHPRQLDSSNPARIAAPRLAWPARMMRFINHNDADEAHPAHDPRFHRLDNMASIWSGRLTLAASVQSTFLAGRCRPGHVNLCQQSPIELRVSRLPSAEASDRERQNLRSFQA